MTSEMLVLLDKFSASENSNLQIAQLEIIRLSGWVNTFIITCVIFIDYKEGGDWRTKNLPRIFKYLIWFSYLVLPWINLTYAVFFIITGSLTTDEALLQPWCITCNVIWMANFAEYYLLHTTIIY